MPDDFDKTRAAILQERMGCYGDFSDTAEPLGRIWSALVDNHRKGNPGGNLPVWMVGLMQVGQKICRLAFDPTNEDSWIDAANYFDLARRAYLGLGSIDSETVGADTSRGEYAQDGS